MKQRYIPPLIMLIAGALTCILDIINKVELITSLKRLLIVLIIFYFIGIIAKAIIIKVTEPKLEGLKEEPKEESEDEAVIQEEDKPETEKLQK
ncbi:MAG TPA: hypothetical protein VJ888_05305 [Mobilitalea sp.]|nr:hypothetical protein [Mobilitalea sp.]